MLQHALEYLGLGYPVFPVCSPRMGQHAHRGAGGTSETCKNPGKRPLVSWEPYQSRLPDETEVSLWWARWPQANIGMATGIVPGVVVLDCDSGEARQLALSNGGLDKTPAVWTGKPGGVHFWLEHPVETVRNFARRLPGLDFRGDGGYVLLPPSVHASGATYRWNPHTVGMRPAPIPDWLWELLRGDGVSDAPSGEHAPLDTEEALGGFDEGHRDDGLFRFACRLRHDDTPPAYAEVLIAAAARACRPPFDVAEAVEKVRYVYRKYEAGGVGPTVVEDGYFAAPGSSLMPAPDPPPEIFLRDISELLAMPEEEPDWMVDQLFTVGSNGWVAAEPKVGKSWVVLELAYALSTGTPFLGKYAVKQPRRVIYVQEEDSRNRTRRRLGQIMKGDPSRGLPEKGYWRWSVRAGFRLDDIAWMEKLRQEIVASKAEVVILDVFNRLHGGDDSNQKEMSLITSRLTRLTNDYGCAFIVAHHNRKPQAGNEARGNQMMRGSGVLAGWSECALYLRKGTKQRAFIVTPESKDAPEVDDFTVTLTDLENGGVLLDVGMVSPQERASRLDGEIVKAVEKLNKDGLDATIQRIADHIGKERTSVGKRMKGLVEEGLLDEDEVQINRNYVKIFTVGTL